MLEGIANKALLGTFSPSAQAVQTCKKTQDLLATNNVRRGLSSVDDVVDDAVPPKVASEVVEGTGNSIDDVVTSESRYIPMDADGTPIPLSKHNEVALPGQDIPLPDPNASGPHTTLGGAVSSEAGEVYLQSATFPEGSWPTANGQNVPWSEVHWYDHGKPHHHQNPHQHIFDYDWEQGAWRRGEPTSYYPK